VLRAVALNDGRPFRKAAAEAVGVPIGSVDRLAEGLVDTYVLRQVGSGQFAFVDPLLEAYAADLAADSLPAVELDDLA
jgi:hypothetical protein